jgi:hypothetical protein
MLVVNPEKKNTTYSGHVFKKTKLCFRFALVTANHHKYIPEHFTPSVESVVEHPINIKTSEHSRSGDVNCSDGQEIFRLSEPKI